MVPDVVLMDTRTPVPCRADGNQVVEGLVSARRPSFGSAVVL